MVQVSQLISWSVIAKKMLFPLIFLALVAQNECSYKDRVKIETNVIRVKYGFGNREHTLDTSIFHDVKPDNCSENDRHFCLKWGDFAEFRIREVSKNCEMYEYKTNYNESLNVIFNMSGLNYFGGAESSFQTWPIQKAKLESVAFVSHEINSQAVLESYWLDSNGNYVYVYPEVPLFVTQNETTLQLTAQRRDPYVRGNITVMNYRLCGFEHVLAAHKDAIAHVLGKPRKIPDFKMVQYPIWSTWAKYKANINQSIVMEFADSILQHGFVNNSQLEIDDMWETCYGSLTIDQKRFPDMRKLVSQLKSKGFRVTLWIHPFINANCEPYFTNAKDLGYLVKSKNGSVITPWWNGAEAGYIDFTNPKASSWFQTNLNNILAVTNIDSYKFDAGESSFSPQVPIYHEMGDNHPERIVQTYVRTCSSFGDMVEMRVARGTQEISRFVRMIDRATSWTQALGLSTLIPELLHMNIIGYPFVMPDMIGGNGYDNYVVTEEMFIRWIQINVFMPVLQFSYPPWELSVKTVEITKRYIDLHTSYAEKIRQLMIEATETGAPVNRPLWWIDPTDPVTHTIDSEYLLGDDLLVAPVIEQGATSRDIYLPKGSWKDENNKSSIIKGPIWLRSYRADLVTLPYFTKVPSGATRALPVSVLITVVIILLFSKCNVISI